MKRALLMTLPPMPNTSGSTASAAPTPTKTLLQDNVNNTSLLSRKGILDRLFTTWFDRLVYPQIWEDPEVDISALQLNQQSRLFTLASGGCNVLNYLSEHPQAVEVVDLNEAHIALLKLKIVALEHLPDSEAFFDFFGRANVAKNLDRYHTYIKPQLDQTTLAYWEGKDKPWRNKRITYFTNNFYRHGLLGKFIGFIHWTSKRLGYDLKQIMQARNLAEQQVLFDQHIAPVFHTRLVKFLCHRSIVMYSLGIPPAQFDEMAKESKHNRQGMHQLLAEKARHMACDFPLESNYFAWQAFNRGYDVKRRLAIPRYLQKAHYQSIKDELGKVRISHVAMTERLKQLPDNSLNAYLFLDAQDWMDTAQLTELWQQVARTAMPNARVVFRTAGEHSPLENKLPACLLNQWQTHPADNAALTQADRSGIYGGVHLYVHKPS